MNQTLNPFEKLLVNLAKAGIKFITVGGVACAFNDYVRATEDIDIIIEKTPENIRRLLKFLTTYGQGFGAELKEEDFDDQEGAIRIIEEFPIDVFTVMGGNHYQDLLAQTKTISLQGVVIPYLNAEGLIRLKEGSYREKDKMDIAHLKNLIKK